VTRPSASVAQSAAARTKPIMMELPARTNAAYPIKMREKVTDSWPRNWIAKKSHATLPKRSLGSRRQAAQHCVAGGPNATVHRLALSPCHQKGFGTGLAGKRIFHIGSAMKPRGCPVSRGYGPIAQLDRVTDFYSVGCRFESCWDRQRFQWDV
jgi:hypothetical protein